MTYGSVVEHRCGLIKIKKNLLDPSAEVANGLNPLQISRPDWQTWEADTWECWKPWTPGISWESNRGPWSY
ncbi:hypothetical protein OUZ56_019276 [Daphnia magna]|uniref:Uncharacterized protein n=1 Tax=Daphnia magna TaxID=35525 RepID=A0ABQ9ZB46_9CRUS|nr:hypothetical protein OUZ56_019276 [Daphnia magna]